MYKIATVILARGKYSKRIPHKPLADCGGKKLIEHTLDFALSLPYPTYVYTDMEEIKNICARYLVPVRDKLYENKNGLHRTGEELQKYNEEIGADVLILLQVTSPVRDVNLAKEWVRDFLLSGMDCGIAVHKEDGYFYEINSTAVNYSRQDRRYNDNTNVKTPLYRETGSFYIFHKRQIDKNHITNGQVILFEDPYDIDINTPEDLKKAEAYLEN